MAVPKIRIQKVNEAPVRPAGDYVLYWMTAARRVRHSFALQRAVELSIELLRAGGCRSSWRWSMATGSTPCAPRIGYSPPPLRFAVICRKSCRTISWPCLDPEPARSRGHDSQLSAHALGKKILEWTRNPRDALAILVELNNKYALDSRNPNSYSGIFWVLGRYDRAWGPERAIFGKVRYMSSDNTARKVRVKSYIQRYA